MIIQFEIAEDIAQAFGTGQDTSRAALESLALEGYRTGRLSEDQVRRMLVNSRFQVHEFLKRHDTYLNYTEEDLEQDLETAHHFSQK
jgi:hypothetical protein